jgi:NADPH-dependent 2,4-dienoyl-CoA reductase/sulfur reductase-like enzyme
MLIIGGSDAGISAALRIKELDARTDVTVVAADAYPAFSICGLPFFLSGEVTDWHKLAHHNPDEFEKQGIRLLLGQKAERISPGEKRVTIISDDKRTREIAYDKLLLATGAVPARPPVAGLDRKGVFFLRFMADGLALHRFIEQEDPRKAVIIGGGYIGLETAEALTIRGIKVTVLEFLPEVLSTLDPVMGRLVRTGLEARGVEVITGEAVRSIETENGSLTVQTTGGAFSTDMVLAATGVKPSTLLAQTAGITLGVAGAIQVNRAMTTNVPDILAAGDCAETWHRVLNSKVYMPLGSTAHKQGRVAGENMVGGNCEFQGTLGTQVVQVFDLVAAGTGLRDKQAASAGFNPLTVTSTVPDRNTYYPGAREIHICITGDRRTGKLLGAQIVGHRDSEVSKRIDIVAAAVFNNLAVERLCDLDLSYTPPLSSPWDPLQKAALKWSGHKS